MRTCAPAARSGRGEDYSRSSARRRPVGDLIGYAHADARTQHISPPVSFRGESCGGPAVGACQYLGWSHSENPARRRLCAATSLAAPVRTRECSNSALHRGAGGGGVPRHVVSLESRGGTLSVPAAPCCRRTRRTSQSSPWVRSVTVSHSRNFTRCNVRSVLPCHAPVCDIT